MSKRKIDMYNCDVCGKPVEEELSGNSLGIMIHTEQILGNSLPFVSVRLTEWHDNDDSGVGGMGAPKPKVQNALTEIYIEICDGCLWELLVFLSKKDKTSDDLYRKLVRVSEQIKAKRDKEQSGTSR